MTPRQQAFVREFTIDHNATQAAIRAGYGVAGARVRGAELVANRNVQEALAVVAARVTARTEITAQMVLERAWAIATSDSRDRAAALNIASKAFPEFKEGVVVNNDNRTLQLPEHTTVEDIRSLRDGLRA